MNLSQFYATVGGDYNAALGRLVNDAFMLRFLRKFPADPAFGELTAALAAQELCGAFRAAHTLKGTAATLGLDALAAAASALTEALRPQTALPPQTLVSAVQSAYETAITSIAQLDG